MPRKRGSPRRPNYPARWQVRRPRRLDSARNWVTTYTGKNLAQSYSKRYRVDRVCALIELKMLGFPVSDEDVAAARESLERSAESRRRQREARRAMQEGRLSDPERSEHGFYGLDYDETFAVIVGETSGGAPFGITWQEWDRIQKEDAEHHLR